MAGAALRGRNLALLLFLGAIWGIAFVFITLGLDPPEGAPSFSPVLFAAFRFDIAGALILVVALARKAPMRPSTRAQWSAIVAAALLNVAAYHAFLFWGQRFTTPAVASVIVGLNPIVTTVFSTWLLTDERVGWQGALGLALGLVGIVILATFKGGSLLDARGVGELACLAAILSWSLGSILVRRTRHGMDVFAFTAWQQLLGAAFLHVAAPLLDRPHFVVWTSDGIVSLLYLAVVSSSLGFIIYFTLLERVGPIRTNLVSHVAPVFAAITAFALLGTPFEWRAIAAFALIASGFALVARPTVRPTPR